MGGCLSIMYINHFCPVNQPNPIIIIFYERKKNFLFEIYICIRSLSIDGVENAI